MLCPHIFFLFTCNLTSLVAAATITMCMWKFFRGNADKLASIVIIVLALHVLFTADDVVTVVAPLLCEQLKSSYNYERKTM